MLEFISASKISARDSWTEQPDERQIHFVDDWLTRREIGGQPDPETRLPSLQKGKCGRQDQSSFLSRTSKMVAICIGWLIIPP